MLLAAEMTVAWGVAYWSSQDDRDEESKAVQAAAAFLVQQPECLDYAETATRSSTSANFLPVRAV